MAACAEVLGSSVAARENVSQWNVLVSSAVVRQMIMVAFSHLVDSDDGGVCCSESGDGGKHVIGMKRRTGMFHVRIGFGP